MPNPYASRPDHAFWRRAVAAVAPEDVDPVVRAAFPIGKDTKVVTAGSCFAQHIARTLVKEGFQYLVTESGPQSPHAQDENFGVYPARFGNVYSTRQFLQLFERAYGLFQPQDNAWTRGDGALIDPFRPQIQSAGFASIEALEADRAAHFAAVRRMFEESDVLIFTLGLTETWIAIADGAAFPLAPGVSTPDADEARYGFLNLNVVDMVADMAALIEQARTVNPYLRFILTVSPVPLIATYEQRHVLASTTYSKSALRVVAEIVASTHEDVAYFPSYEIITGAHTRGRYFAEDLREVTPEGVAHVMALFKRHYLGGQGSGAVVRPAGPSKARAKAIAEASAEAARTVRQLEGVICEEEALDPVAAKANP